MSYDFFESPHDSIRVVVRLYLMLDVVEDLPIGSYLVCLVGIVERYPKLDRLRGFADQYVVFLHFVYLLDNVCAVSLASFVLGR